MDNKLIDILRLLRNSGMHDLIDEFQKNFDEQRIILSKAESHYSKKVQDALLESNYETAHMYIDILSGIKDYSTQLNELQDLETYIVNHPKAPTEETKWIRLNNDLSFKKPITLELSGVSYNLGSRTWVGVITKLFEILSEKDKRLFEKYMVAVNNDPTEYCRFFTNDQKAKITDNTFYLKTVDRHCRLRGDANGVGKVGFELLKLFNLESSCRVSYIDREK